RARLFACGEPESTDGAGTSPRDTCGVGARGDLVTSVKAIPIFPAKDAGVAYDRGWGRTTPSPQGRCPERYSRRALCGVRPLSFLPPPSESKHRAYACASKRLGVGLDCARYLSPGCGSGRTRHLTWPERELAVALRCEECGCLS